MTVVDEAQLPLEPNGAELPPEWWLKDSVSTVDTNIKQGALVCSSSYGHGALESSFHAAIISTHSVIKVLEKVAVNLSRSSACWECVLRASHSCFRR